MVISGGREKLRDDWNRHPRYISFICPVCRARNGADIDMWGDFAPKTVEGFLNAAREITTGGVRS